jgi:hypothetical protein
MAKRIVWTDQARLTSAVSSSPPPSRSFKTLGCYVLTGEGGA